VDRLELVVNQGALDQLGHVALMVGEAFEVVQTAAESVRWRRHEYRDVEGVGRRADPVLGSSELSRLAVAAPHAGEKHGVDLTEQPHAEREVVEELQASVEGAHIVEDLLDVPG